MSGDRLRRAVPEDETAVLSLIHRCLREVNLKDYGPEKTEELCRKMDADWFQEAVGQTHYYVLERDGEILATGGVREEGETEGSAWLFGIFVLPEMQGKGLGTRMVERLEQDPVCRERFFIELASSITAHEFYRKLGFEDYTDDVDFSGPGGTTKMSKVNL